MTLRLRCVRWGKALFPTPTAAPRPAHSPPLQSPLISHNLPQSPQSPLISPNLHDLPITRSRSGSLDEAVVALQRALAIASELDDDEAKGECNTRLGAVFVQQKEWSKALPCLLQSASVWTTLADSLHETHKERVVAGEAGGECH